jgi:hypothetical protein
METLMPIDIRALRYFVETARLKSFTQAASSLCHAIDHQQDGQAAGGRGGAAAFDSRGKTVRLTDVGRGL